jgi:hypothetical protein
MVLTELVNQNDFFLFFDLFYIKKHMFTCFAH